MKYFFGLICLGISLITYAQNATSRASDVGTSDTGTALASSVRLAATVMRQWPDTGETSTARWTYDDGIWKGMEALWLNTGDGRYFKYIQHQVDRLVDKEGDILCGRVLLMLYKVTGQEKYYRAAGRLRQQLKEQPRTSEGSFWLDGLYMAQPFLAEYAALFHEDSVFTDITKQFVTIEQRMRDGKTGARAMGWYGMALVDVLEQYPARGSAVAGAGRAAAGAEPGREVLLAILRRYATAVVKVQDPATGCWRDDTSASCMFVYTLAKGVRLGYLPASFLEAAKKGYRGLEKKFIVSGPDGQSNLEGTVSVGGVGAFLLAAGEMDPLADRALGKGKTVLLDYYFNNEHHKDVTGAVTRFHYIWEEMDNNGYSLWGHLFRQYGMVTDSLAVAPTTGNLRKAAIYIIVDPDNEKESPVPNFIRSKDADEIENWVKAGGVLVLLGNDSANMEFTHFNELAGRFGIHFNFDDYHKVTGSQFEMGAFTMTVQDAIFPTTKKIYIKELSTLKLDGPAKPHFTDNGNVIMAVARVGKGTVFAVGDPWFYNEYTDGRKLPADFENFNAARDLTQWLIRQANNK